LLKDFTKNVQRDPRQIKKPLNNQRLFL
jgi:hypothetical protein